VELQSSGKLIGRCVVSQIQTLQPEEEVVDHWYALMPKSGNTDQSETVTGFLELRLLYSKIPESVNAIEVTISKNMVEFSYFSSRTNRQ